MVRVADVNELHMDVLGRRRSGALRPRELRLGPRNVPRAVCAGRSVPVPGQPRGRSTHSHFGRVASRVTQILTIAAALKPGQQQYLLEARQMQALSFAVHIPLVCFGIALPPLLLFLEWLYLRTSDELYRTLARRWTRIMVALFAAGVVTGT